MCAAAVFLLPSLITQRTLPGGGGGVCLSWARTKAGDVSWVETSVAVQIRTQAVVKNLFCFLFLLVLAGGVVWVITTANCAHKALVRSILERFPQAQLLRPPDFKNLERNVAADFRFLLNSPRLLLGKSTFGFWAGECLGVLNVVDTMLPLQRRFWN